MRDTVKRPRAPLVDGGSMEEPTESVANVYIPNRYKVEFGTRLRYLERFYRVKVVVGESPGERGSSFLLSVSGKEDGVNAVVAAVNQWALGCV